MDPRNTSAVFRASCWTKARLVPDFVTGRVSFALTFNEARELDEIRVALRNQIAEMEDTWDDILENVRQHSFDTNKDAAFGEWSRLVTSARKIVDMALKVASRFQEAPPVSEEFGEDPGPDETKDKVVGDIPNDAAVDLGKGVDDNKFEEDAEDSAKDNEDRHEVKEVPQSRTGLTHEELEEVLREQWTQGCVFAKTQRSTRNHCQGIHKRPTYY